MTYITIHREIMGRGEDWIVVRDDGQVTHLTEAQATAVAALLNEMEGEFPEWLDKDERKIISKLLDAILADPLCHVEVPDEEGVSLRPSRDRRQVERGTAAAGETYYIVFRAQPNGDLHRVGFIRLIHGNGVDVISDYSDKADLERLIQPALDFANTL